MSNEPQFESDLLERTAISFMQEADTAFDTPLPFESPSTVARMDIDRLAALEELERISRECSTNGWDGEGGLPVLPETICYAFRLILDLPRTLPVPEVSAYENGRIGLDWFGPNRALLSISVDASGWLTYASIKQDEPRRGRVRFKAQTPDEVYRILGWTIL